MKTIAERIAAELNVRVSQVDATIALLDGKATVPFIARYRKEATGGLDDTALRTLEERLIYLRELEERRAAVLKSIQEQGALTTTLAAAIQDAGTKARLEDLYLPYKPKRRIRNGRSHERSHPRHGDIVTVTVVDIDLNRRRIALTMKRQAPGGGAAEPTASTKPHGQSRPSPTPARPAAAPGTAMAAAFAKLPS